MPTSSPANDSDGAGFVPAHLNTCLRNLALAPPVVVAPQASVRDVLRTIDARDADLAVVVDAASEVPLGIVTLRDALRAIVGEQCDMAGPVAGLMTGGLVSLAADSSVHQATLLMFRRGMRHLVLTEADGRLFSVVSQSDLYGMHATDSASLIDAILASRTVRELADQSAAVRRFAQRRLVGGSGPEALCEWISALNDLIAMQVIDLVEGEFELPYVPWCWMVFGSEGRLEQTLVTDQDNGIIFAAETAQQAEELRAKFLPFAKAVNQALDACGFPLCSGDIMAGNPAWCLSSGEWKKCFDNWIAIPEPQALLNSTIFFDFRPLYGHEELVAELQTWLLQRTRGNTPFLRAMASVALEQEPPLAWWRDFRLDGGKEHPHTLDLKAHGVRLFVDAARVLALDHGVAGTNTVERLRALSKSLGMRLPASEIEATAAAFFQLQRLRLQNQVRGDAATAANRLDPDRLHKLDRQILKEALRQVRTLQQRLQLDYLS